jgi:hypothetical protein
LIFYSDATNPAYNNFCPIERGKILPIYSIPPIAKRRWTIGWWMFAATGTLALLIALATVSFQSIKLALANPIKSLRTD